MSQFSLDQSPFAVLKVSPRSQIREIEEAVEDITIDFPSRETDLLKEKNKLLTPNLRLFAEVSWLSELSPKSAADIVENLKKGHLPLLRATIADLPPLAAANVAADAAERFGDCSFISRLVEAHRNVRVEDVTGSLTGLRITSRFPPVVEAQVAEALKSLRRRHAGAAIACIEKQSRPAEALASIFETFEAPQSEFVTELMRAYDHWSLPALSAVEQELEQSLASVVAGDGTAVQRLCDHLRSWDELSQPAQLHAQASGLDEPRTLRIYRIVRSACVDLANEQSRYEDAKLISSTMRKLFQELPSARVQLDGDLDQLTSLATEAQTNKILESLEAAVTLAREDVREFVSELSRLGFTGEAAGRLIGPLWRELRSAHQALQNTSQPDAALAIIRGFSLEINNDYSDPKAALALVEGARKCAPPRSADIAEKIREDAATLRSNIQFDLVTKAAEAKKFSEAAGILDVMLAAGVNEDDRQRLTLLREQIVQRRNRKVIGWAFWGVLGLVVISSVFGGGVEKVSDIPPPAADAAAVGDELPATAETAADAAATAAAVIASDSAAIPEQAPYGGAPGAPVDVESGSNSAEISKPPAGTDLKLNISQLRYCQFEQLRLNHINAMVDENSNQIVDNFNERVDDYNARCGSYSYLPSDLDAAKRAAESARSQLEAEADEMVKEWTR